MVTSAPPAAGSIVGGEYRIVRQLGAGGMGAVYVAEQASTGKLRALKLMHPALVADARQRERFAQEARVSALIPSEHVVQVIGAGVDQGTGAPWIAMELLEGEDLAAALRRRGALPPAEVHELFRQIGHALGAAHRAGIVHRDIKPENIFLARAQRATEAVTARILDFGIAKVVAEAGATGTAALGTPLWMAPEQTDAQARLTPAVDVWPLGLIAFAALTGRMYWRAANDASIRVPALLREVLFEPLAPASARAAELGAGDRVPPGFDAWFARCVERDVGARYPTAAEALDALGAALFGAGAAAALTSGASGAVLTPPALTPPGVSLPSGSPAAAATTAAAPGEASAGASWVYAPTGVATPADAAAPSAVPALSAGSAPPAATSWAHSGPAPGTLVSGFAPAAPMPPFTPPGGPGATPPGLVAGLPAHPVHPPYAAPLHGPPRRGALLLLLGVGGGVVITLGALVLGAVLLRGGDERRQRPPGREAAIPTAVVTGPSPIEPVRGGSPTRPTAPPKPPQPPAPLPSTVPTPLPPTAQPPPGPRPFDHQAAQQSVQQAANVASSLCNSQSGKKPLQSAPAVVFKNDGGVRKVNMSPADFSSAYGSCVYGALSRARPVPPYDGPEQSVVAGVPFQ